MDKIPGRVGPFRNAADFGYLRPGEFEGKKDVIRAARMILLLNILAQHRNP